MVISNLLKNKVKKFRKIKEYIRRKSQHSIIHVHRNCSMNAYTMKDIILHYTGAERLMENANDTIVYARQQMRDVTLGLQAFAWLCVIICIYDFLSSTCDFGFKDAYGYHYSISSRTVWGAVDAFFYAIVSMAIKESWPSIIPHIRHTKTSIIIMFEDILMLLPLVKKPWEIISGDKYCDLDDWDNCLDNEILQNEISSLDIPDTKLHTKLHTKQHIIVDYFNKENSEDDWQIVTK